MGGVNLTIVRRTMISEIIITPISANGILYWSVTSRIWRYYPGNLKRAKAYHKSIRVGNHVYHVGGCETIREKAC